MDYSNNHIVNILKTSLSDIIAGSILLIVSIMVYLEMFNILRNPVFNGMLGLIFIFAAYTSVYAKEYHNKKEHLLNFDLNGLIAGIFLLVIAFLGALGQFDVIHNFIFPLIPGILLIAVAFIRTIINSMSTRVTIYRIDPCGIVGGEALILYSILLYMDLTSLAWSPIFPLFISIALFTSLLIDIMPQIISSQAGINKANLWLNDIENKISMLRNEFESIKLNYNDPQFRKNIERLTSVYNSLIAIKEIRDFVKQSDYTLEYFAKADSTELETEVMALMDTDTSNNVIQSRSESITPESITPESITPESITPESVTPESVTPELVTPESVTPESVTSKSITPESVTSKSVTPESTTPKSVTPGSRERQIQSEISANDLEELVKPKDSDQIFFENLQKEFAMDGLSSIIKEAKEMRKSIIAEREKHNN